MFFNSDNNIKNLFKIVNQEIERIRTWVNANKLSIGFPGSLSEVFQLFSFFLRTLHISIYNLRYCRIFLFTAKYKLVIIIVINNQLLLSRKYAPTLQPIKIINCKNITLTGLNQYLIMLYFQFSVKICHEIWWISTYRTVFLRPPADFSSMM